MIRQYQRIINALAALLFVSSIGFFVLIIYLRIHLGANARPLFIAGNLWLWFTGVILAVMYYYTKRQLEENTEKLSQFKEHSRKLFLMWGALCIFSLLASIWIISSSN